MSDEIYNENCIEGMQRMPADSVDLVVTDPPYGIEYRSGWRREKYGTIIGDNGLQFLDETCREFERVMKPNTAVYMFCSWHRIDEFKQTFERYFKLKNILIWVKNAHGSGDLRGSYSPKYEMVLFGSKGRSLLRGKRMEDVLQYDRVSGSKSIHATQKPVKLLKAFIENSSDPGAIVLDPFLGSGSTAVAAVELGRHYIGYELSPEYFDIACKRIDAAKGDRQTRMELR